MFVGDARFRLDSVKDAVASGDLALVASTAHAFKSAAGTVRADRLARLLHRLERAGRNEAGDDAGAIASEVELEYERVMGFLREVEVAT